MTNKEIKQFTKDMLKIVSQQSKKINANKENIKGLRKIIESLLERELKVIESTEKYVKSKIEKPNQNLVKQVEGILGNKNRTCIVTLFLNEKNMYLPKEELDKKMNDFKKELNIIMVNYGIEDVTAKMMRKI